MKSIKFLAVALVAMVAFAACSKEKSAELVLDRTSLYFTAWGDPAQRVRYVAREADGGVAIASLSPGWNAMMDYATQSILVWPEGATEEGVTNDDLPKEGSVVVNALNKEGKATSYNIYVYICETHLVGVNSAANCYVLTTPGVNYTFDVMHRPVDGAPLDTKSVKLLWQSNSGVVKNVNLVDGKATFYVAPSEADATRLEETNAVVAACDASGEVIWSWHLWIVNNNPLAAYDTYSNGKSFMRVNLGAFTNSEGEIDEQKIYDSYGMYYQWGRKEPFQRPYYFDAAGADDETRYTELGTYIKEEHIESSATTGTVDYARKNPLQFIFNSEGESGDWLASANNELWSDGEKSINDPCPYGWRVPAADDLKVLTLDDATDNTPLESARKQYGWHLSDDVSHYFYPACGRRRYSDGKVENMNSKEGVYPSQPQPWEGYYWTSTTDGGKSVALYFDLTTTRTINKFELNHAARRANGFQIRCVKE